MGVNFPAHLVVIKSTSQYISGCYKEYSDTQLFQMLGRAGRPQVSSFINTVAFQILQIHINYIYIVCVCCKKRI